MKNSTILKAIDSNQIRYIQLGLLKCFVETCEKNNIRYFMAYGSLLGTIRHRGFIPWDDDIDVMVLREDIDSLGQLFKKGRYKLINSSIDNKYFSPLFKLYDSSTLLIQSYGQNEGKNLGIYLDVFVLDNVPFDENQRKLFYKKAESLRFRWSLSCRKFSAKSRNVFVSLSKMVLSIPFKLIGYRYFAKKYENYAKSCNQDLAKAIVVYGEGFEKEYVYLEKDLNAKIMSFEGINVKVPINYDSILKKYYGNYMIMPPIEERKKHSFKAFYIDNSSD